MQSFQTSCTQEHYVSFHILHQYVLSLRLRVNTHKNGIVIVLYGTCMHCFTHLLKLEMALYIVNAA